MAGSEMNPFQKLRDIDARCRANAFGLPRQVAVRNRWVGIALRVADTPTLIELGEAEEIMRVPELGRVPGTRDWIAGIANVRSTLLPVVDLKLFASGAATRNTRRARVLVVRSGDFKTGLLVDEVFGMRRFFAEDRWSGAPKDSPLADYIDSFFQFDGVDWGVLNVAALAHSEQFLAAAA